MNFHWSCFNKPIIQFCFDITKLNFGSVSDMHKLLHYIDYILEIGEKEEVTHLRPEFTSSRKLYIESMKEKYEEAKDFTFLLDYSGNGGISIPTIYYEDTSGFQRHPVTSMTDLMVNIGGKLNKNFDSSGSYYPALHVYASRTGFLKDRVYNDMARFTIFIELYTDIWFPWVGDWNLDRYEPYIQEEGDLTYQWDQISLPRSFDDLFDNRLLAECNGKRFNRFISEVATATKEYGEIRIYNDSFSNFYAPQIEGTQIRFDIAPTRPKR